jgi:hypothetical protein
LSLAFSLVELRVGGGLVVLPMSAGELLAGFPLGFRSASGPRRSELFAVGDVPVPKILKAGRFLLLGVQHPVAGLGAMLWTVSRSTASVLLVSAWTGSSTEAPRVGSEIVARRFA